MMDGWRMGGGGYRRCLAVCWSWRFCIGRPGRAGKCTCALILKVVAIEVPPLGRTIPSIHRPSLAGCLTAHFLLFRPVDFSQLPIIHRLCHPNSVPSSILRFPHLVSFSPPFLPSASFSRSSPSLSPNIRHLSTNHDQPGPRLLLLSSSLLLSTSPHTRFVTTTRRNKEKPRTPSTVPTDIVKLHALDVPFPIIVTRLHHLAPGRPTYKRRKNPFQSPLEHRFQDPSYAYENLACSKYLRPILRSPSRPNAGDKHPQSLNSRFLDVTNQTSKLSKGLAHTHEISPGDFRTWLSCISTHITTF